MSHPWHHSKSSAKRWGGKPQDYQKIHDWFDATKAHFPDPRHRAMRHHSEGIFLCESIFGTTITNSLGQEIPVRILGEQHVQEDLGWIPTMADWLRCMKREPWMNRVPGPDGVLTKDIGRQRSLKLKRTVTTISLNIPRAKSKSRVKSSSR